MLEKSFLCYSKSLVDSDYTFCQQVSDFTSFFFARDLLRVMNVFAIKLNTCLSPLNSFFKNLL